ncbi:ABC transporter, ATP-binding protein (cluster 9, phospholipid) [hydrothermal vent metagenome]|uniref:ABC transporter, ATP-binding protein (Cluster 9, phospholipid) n=1 Tax=hydrothermal vent metagenome TaxID=652676 RepID=A0A3B0YIP7_9ZZZZ
MTTATETRASPVSMPEEEAVIQVRNLRTTFGRHVVHNGINLDVMRGEVLALAGGSGSGKSTLLQEMIMLLEPAAGSIRFFGTELAGISEHAAQQLRHRIGVLFQQGALFSGMTVLENVGVPLREHTHLDNVMIDALARLKISQAGLEPEAASLYPGELSGGMIKRAALARAMALDPEVLFLDEPTSGLDPASAGLFDELVLKLKDLLGLTVLMVTHDLDSLWAVADRVAILGNGTLRGVDSMQGLSASTDPLVREFFEGPRARRARERHWTKK